MNSAPRRGPVLRTPYEAPTDHWRLDARGRTLDIRDPYETDALGPGIAALESGVPYDHDGQSFFARRIHFPGKGSDRQLKRFRSALASRIEPRLWDTMLSLTSAPFRRPKSGRIAVRIITTTGDEMLAVRDVPERRTPPVPPAGARHPGRTSQ